MGNAGHSSIHLKARERKYNEKKVETEFSIDSHVDHNLNDARWITMCVLYLL